jgi:hypothetical protein
MSTVDEYHKYARDCLRWAARARTEEQRRQFLTLAQDWTQAASGLEGMQVPPQRVDAATTSWRQWAKLRERYQR